MFVFRNAYIRSIHALSLAVAIWAAAQVALGAVSAAWLLLWFAAYLLFTAAGSVGAHRLFCHQAFQTGAAWHVALALLTSCIAIGSPIQWAAGHTAHHDHADTEHDPHNAGGWRALLLGRYVRPPRYSFRFARHLVSNRWHRRLHQAGVLVPLALAALLAVLDGNLLVYGYLAPLGTALTVSALHNIVAHRGGQPRDLPWMLLLLPFEWAHAAHHRQPQAADMAAGYRWLPDPGAWLIRGIARPPR